MLKFGIKDLIDPRLLKRLILTGLSLCFFLQKCFRVALSKFTLDGRKILETFEIFCVDASVYQSISRAGLGILLSRLRQARPFSYDNKRIRLTNTDKSSCNLYLFFDYHVKED